MTFKASEDTKKLIRHLVKNYDKQQNDLRKVMHILIKLIKDRYEAFIKADLLVKYIVKNGTKIIANTMYNRYMNAIDEIKYKRFNNILMVRELMCHINLLVAFFDRCYFEGYSQPFAYLLFHTEIINRIKQGYENI